MSQRRRTAQRPRGGAPAGEEVTLLSDDDLYLFNEGTHAHLYEKLGAHPIEAGGRPGTAFAVWAPSARFVSVIGDFNGWDRGASVLRACLAHLADSPAALLMVGLEDLWLETRPQNVPGTTDEVPNWRRTARYAFESFRAKPRVVSTLREIDRLRKRDHG